VKKFFVPSGTVVFVRSYAEFLNLLYSLNGKMENNQDFHCYVSVPARKRRDGISFLIMRGFTRFRFCGNILPFGDTYKITYRVYPGLSSLAFLIVPVYLFFQSLSVIPNVGPQEILENITAYIVVSFALLGLFLLLRHFAIRQFVRQVEEYAEDSNGIFD